MAERAACRFRPGPAGIAALLLPPLLLYRGISAAGAVPLVVGLGLPAAAVLSLLFLLAGMRRIAGAARRADGCASALPSTCPVGGAVTLTVDPPRPRFLPGILLSVRWELVFGPFRRVVMARLPATGTGTAALVLDRRGEWTCRSFLRASDPFGFFRLDCPCGRDGRVTAPPVLSAVEGTERPGRPDARSQSAPRLKEDADVKMERRSYVPGDDPRRLDWKHFARSGEMLIRLGEDGIPIRGRIWIQVLSGTLGRGFRRASVRRLDYAVQAAADLARRLENDGGDVRVLLPGESDWKAVGEDFPARAARPLPGQPPPDRYPAPGERLWMISPPEAGAAAAAVRAAAAGCRVTLGFPSLLRIPGFPRSPAAVLTTRGGKLSPFFDSYFHRRRLIQAENKALEAGIDVRRI